MNDPFFDPMLFGRIRAGKKRYAKQAHIKVFVSITNNMILWLKGFQGKKAVCKTRAYMVCLET
jgi:hypothetical protein